MKKYLSAFGMAVLLSACATGNSNPPVENRQVVYVDKPMAEYTRPVQRVVQVSPCLTCPNFHISARVGMPELNEIEVKQ